MKKSYSKSKKNFLALLLSVLMVTSCAAAFSACGNDANTDDSSSSSTESTDTSVNDNGLIKNANFKTANTNDGLNPIVTSVTGWSRSVNSGSSGSSASSSTAQSGILNTSAEAWENLTRLEKNVEVPVETAKANWDSFSVNEKLAYYEYWKKQNPDDKNNIKTKLADFYQIFNIDQDDIPTVNPGTHYAEDEEGDDNVLMIHNQASKDIGTSQKFTSSSTVTVPAGAAAKFSVWVKTAELNTVNSDNEKQDAIGKGAYVRVTHSVGNTSLPAFEIKNINTEEVNPDGDNNGWVQYSFYLSASSFSNTTFTIVLGLGQGTSSERLENVNGYAFFDDIQCELVELYDESQLDAFSDLTVGFESTADEKVVDAHIDGDASKFALDFHGDFTASTIFDTFTNGDVSYTTGTYKKDDTYTSAKDNKPLPTLKNGGFDTTNDVTGVYTLTEIAELANGNTYLSSVYDNHLVSKNEKGAWLKNDQDILLLMSAQGVAYTADSTFTFNFYNDETKAYEDYMLISFFVKTSNLNGHTGAGISLNDGDAVTSFDSIDTSSIAAVKIGENEDVYDGWQQVFFFVENGYAEGAESSFTLSFNYGLTDVTGATDDSFYEGFAAFTGFETNFMTKEEYTAAATGTYAKKVTVSNVEEDATLSNAGFDTATNVPSEALKEGFADLKNYSGVYSDSYYVTQPDGEFTNQDYLEHTKINQYATAGVLNKDYFIGTKDDASYFNENFALYEQMKAATGETTAEGVWNKMFGAGVSQPLLIWNEGMTKRSYGFIGNKTTISANDYATISVRVKASDATAYIYLVDMDDKTYSSTLSIGSNRAYWYDSEGNVLTNDPDETSEKALVLQSNGLYKVNSKWSTYKKLSADAQNAYYANLSAYEKRGNDLIVAEGGAAHAYTKADENGNVIAFYGDGNGNYYADAAKKVKVIDFYTLTETQTENSNLKIRYEAEEDRQLVAKVGDTQDKWVTVTFYIHTGELAKNYRLEVWSGARDASSVNTINGSYVIFDVNNPGDVESNFANLIEERKDDADDTFETVFSYFDTDKFLRYDRDLDKDSVGNLYKDSYNATEQTEGVAYLKYVENGSQTVLVDYSVTDKTVAAQDVSDDDGDDDTSSSDNENESETNLWMLFSSIAVAVALVFAIAAIIIRKSVEKYRKKHGIKVKAPKEKKVKKQKSVKAKAPEETQDENSPYND